MQSSSKDELRGGDERLAALATHSSTIIWHTDAQGAAQQRNPSWEAFTGQDAAAYTGWGWLDAVHPEDRPAMEQTWRDAAASARPFTASYRVRRADGAWRLVQAQATPLLEGGGVREWVGACVDVTDRHATETALRESELRLAFLDRLGQATRELTEASEVMAVTTRLLGGRLGATRCAYADVEPDGDRFTIRNDWTLPGVPSSAGVYSLDLFGPQATGNLRAGRHLVVNDVDAELGDAGGGRMFKAIGIRAIICAALVKEGRLVAMMAVHQAQPRHWTHQEIALVGEVVDRCWAHIERVRDAAMLREQDRRKDEFLATLAHELRNPLAPVKYALALMREADDPALVQQAREVADRQVTHMARLIDDLLDLSRISRGLIQLQRARVPVATVLHQALEAARPALEEGRHRLVAALPAADLAIDADATRLVQVVANLLGNAAKYTPAGGEIRLAGRRIGDEVVLEVADNGIGIAPAQQGLLFQMFTQLDQGAAQAKGGLGIGLALARRLVELHGGSIAVASAGAGQGSTFTVRLPLPADAVTVGAGAPEILAPTAPPPTVATPAVATPAAPTPAGVAPTAPQAGAVAPMGPVPADAAPATSAPATHAAATPPGRRVLVVEDNPDGRDTLMLLLDMLGYQVDGAGDGQAALEAAARFRPEVVLLDLGLPVLDGLEVGRRLRADPAQAGVRIVALTGWGAERDRERTRAAGFDAHLTKPVEPDALLACLEELAGTPAA